MSFRKIKTVLRETGGYYEQGRWIPGDREVLTTSMSVQPLNANKAFVDMMPMPEGRHMSDYVKIYSDIKLQVAVDGEGMQPDIVVQEGYGYELASFDGFRSDVINHFKYIGYKLFKFTTNEEWIDGTLSRTYEL